MQTIYAVGSLKWYYVKKLDRQSQPRKSSTASIHLQVGAESLSLNSASNRLVPAVEEDVATSKAALVVEPGASEVDFVVVAGLSVRSKDAHVVETALSQR